MSSYDFEKNKVKPLPLTIKTLPKYTKFFMEHKMTPQQYVDYMEEMKKKGMTQIDIKQFISQEKALGSRRRKSELLPTPKPTPIRSLLFPESEQYKMTYISPEEKMKQVTYFNTDLNKYVTTLIPEKMNILGPIRETSKDLIEIPDNINDELSTEPTESKESNESSIFNSEDDDVTYINKLVNYDEMYEQYLENIKRLQGGAPKKHKSNKNAKRLKKAYKCIQNGNYKDAEIITFSMMM